MEIGEIVFGSPYSVEWNIPDFYRLWENFQTFRSPKFKCMGAKWHLEIQKDMFHLGSYTSIFIHLVEDVPSVLDDNWFKIGFRKSDGRQFTVYNGNSKRNEINGRKWVKYISLEKSELRPEGRPNAISLKVQESYFIPYHTIRPQRCVSPKDTVTVYCVLQDQMEGRQQKLSSEMESCEDFGKLSHDFKDLLLTGENSDAVIKVNDSEFHVHKVILSARSPVFASMFKHDMKEKSSGVVCVSDCTADAFYDFLLYLYSGKLEAFSREKIFYLYLTADKYDVKELKSACVKFLMKDLCIDTFCDVLSLALRHEESALLETVSKFFEKNVKKIIVTAKWQAFLTENPIKANELHIKALNNILPD